MHPLDPQGPGYTSERAQTDLACGERCTCTIAILYKSKALYSTKYGVLSIFQALR